MPQHCSWRSCNVAWTLSCIDLVCTSLFQLLQCWFDLFLCFHSQMTLIFLYIFLKSWYLSWSVAVELPEIVELSWKCILIQYNASKIWDNHASNFLSFSARDWSHVNNLIHGLYLENNLYWRLCFLTGLITTFAIKHTAAGYKFCARLHYFGVDVSHSLWSFIKWFDQYCSFCHFFLLTAIGWDYEKTEVNNSSFLISVSSRVCDRRCCPYAPA